MWRASFLSSSSLDFRLISILFVPYLTVLSTCLITFGDSLTNVSQAQDHYPVCGIKYTFRRRKLSSLSQTPLIKSPWPESQIPLGMLLHTSNTSNICEDFICACRKSMTFTETFSSTSWYGVRLRIKNTELWVKNAQNVMTCVISIVIWCDRAKNKKKEFLRYSKH